MVLRRKVAFLCAFLVFVLLGFLFYSYSDQPYYHTGLSMTLTPDGLRVRKVAADGPAYNAGLRVGTLIESVNGLEAQALFELSNTSLSQFLRVSSGLFRQEQELTLQIVGEQDLVRYVVEPLPWRVRAALFEPEVLINFVVASLFLLSGVWLMAVRKQDHVVVWFFAFTLAVTVALSLSYFISYWSTAFLTMRFVLLDAAGILAGCSLVGFAYRFPDGPPLSRRARFVMLSVLGLFFVKYVLVVSGVTDPLGAALYLVHAVVAASLVLAIVLIVRRYRYTHAGGRRRIRWAAAGIVVSLLPFIVYLAALIARGSILDEGATLIGRFASLGLILFPVFVGIGVVRYSLFDIDRLLNRFAVVMAIAIITTGAFSLLFFYFIDSDVSLQLYLFFLAVALLSPVMYLQLDRFADRVTRQWRRERGYKDPGQILLEMEQELVGVFRKEDVYAIVSSSLVQAYEPTSIQFVTREKHENTVEFAHPPIVEDGKPEFGKLEDGLREFFLFEEDGREAVLRIGGRRDEDIYTREDLRQLSGAAAQVSKSLLTCELHRCLQESLASTELAQHTAILALAKLTEYRDNETGRHLERIQEYTRLLARAMRGSIRRYAFLTEEIIEDFCRCSVLHDIGKVGVPDSILLKPGPLTPLEFAVIQQHPTIGGQVLEDAEALQPDRSFLSIAKTIAYQHHEKWDGTGYPLGLSGDDIALPARIVALADVYDALRSVRPYKDAMPHESALDIVAEGSGTHFDPELVTAFLSIQAEVATVPR